MNRLLFVLRRRDAPYAHEAVSVPLGSFDDVSWGAPPYDTFDSYDPYDPYDPYNPYDPYDPYGFPEDVGPLPPPDPKKQLSSGLRNSIRFMIMLMESLGVPTKLVEVADANSIDRELKAFRPTHCILEAVWVPPAKIDQLRNLHPHVHWIVRDHSETPFLAQEGQSFSWMDGYLRAGVEVMCNAPRAAADIRRFAMAHRYNDRLVTYGPNYYPAPGEGAIVARPHRTDGTVHVGCFGAIRPLKNHVLQAIAALGFARKISRTLVFHINSVRLEMGANPVLRNLRAIFTNSGNHRMVEHGWMQHEDFLAVLRTMDISLQASLSETFNIVLADSVTSSVPVIGTTEIPWLGPYGTVDPLNGDEIEAKLIDVWDDPAPARRLHRQRLDLLDYCLNTRRIWSERFAG